MSPCNRECPCRYARQIDRLLTADERMKIEKNHWPEGSDTEVPAVDAVSAAQGDVHWLDWHDVENP